jgi:hypothetical protein
LPQAHIPEMPLAATHPRLPEAKPVFKTTETALLKAKPVSKEKIGTGAIDLKIVKPQAAPQHVNQSTAAPIASQVVRREPDSLPVMMDQNQPEADQKSTQGANLSGNMVNEKETDTHPTLPAEGGEISMPLASLPASEINEEPRQKIIATQDRRVTTPEGNVSWAGQTVPSAKPIGLEPPNVPQLTLQKRLQNKKKGPVQVNLSEGVQIRKAHRTPVELPASRNLIKLTLPDKTNPEKMDVPQPHPAASYNFSSPTQGQTGNLLPLPTQAIHLASSPVLGEKIAPTAFGKPSQTRPASIFRSPRSSSIDMPHAMHSAPISAATNVTPADNDIKPAASAVASARSANAQVVQRSLDNPAEEIENRVGQAKDKVMGKLGIGGAKSGKGGDGNSSNLEKLAEDVFPLIKRLLEIEKDRTSGLLR